MDRRVGYWCSSFEPNLPDPHDYVDPSMPETERQTVCAYLEAGREHTTWRGFAFCRFGCPGAFGSRCLTDGTWVWPEGLAHYVSAHSVRLPEAFLAHIEKTKAAKG